MPEWSPVGSPPSTGEKENEKDDELIGGLPLGDSASSCRVSNSIDRVIREVSWVIPRRAKHVSKNSLFPVGTQMFVAQTPQNCS